MLEGIMTDAQVDDLERLVDRYGMQQVLETLANIAGEKSTFISETWDDAHLALQWMRVSNLISAASEKALGL